MHNSYLADVAQASRYYMATLKSTDTTNALVLNSLLSQFLLPTSLTGYPPGLSPDSTGFESEPRSDN